MSLVSPYRADRARARAAHTEAGLSFVEVFVDTPLAVCEGGARARAAPGDGDPATMASAILTYLDR